jgi:hypothetical protein
MLRFFGVQALETDRFMSWDSFLAKSRRGSVPKGKIQADPSYRLLWASAFIEGQAENPRLRKIIKPGLAPPSSLASSLARIAPRLPSLIEAAAAMSDPPPAWAGENLVDSQRLCADYAAFLDRHGLYEASWLPPELEAGRTYLAFWPSLYPGFTELKEGLLDSGRFECFGDASEGFSPDRCSVRRYPSAREELSSVFSDCRAFLDAGLRPEDIVLSLPNLDPETKAYLGSFSKGCGLPLAYRSGEPLSSSPFGSLLSSIQACLGEGFSLRTLRRLLEPRSFAWRRQDELAELLRFGEKYRIPEAAFASRETMLVWKESLRTCKGEGQGSYSLFSELASAAEAFQSARSFSALRAALHDFRRRFLDERSLPKEASETMERVFVALDGLDACEARLGDGMPGRGRFDLLLSILDSTPYAPDSRESAIAVYPYQVGALVAAPLHFVLDLSQESTQPAKLHFTGLPRELSDRSGEGAWSEDELLSALGAAGAVYCHAEKGIAGYSVPHPFLLSLAEGRPEPSPWPRAPSAEELETAAWAAGDPGLLPPRLPSWAKRGAFRGCRALSLARGAVDSATGGAGKARGSQGRGLDPKALLSLPACDARPDFKFSPARLKTIGLCPFRWFASCVPGVEAPFKDPIPAAEGSLTHNLIGALLVAIAARDGKVDETKTAEYLHLFDELFPSRLEAALRKNGPSLRIALELVQPKLRSRMATLLGDEARFEQDGWNIGEFEVALSKRYASQGIRLEGRADRIARDEADAGEPLLALVDYKKNKTPAKKDFLVDDEGKLADFQLVAYASMLDSQGKRMKAALYWSVETCKPLTVFGPGGERPDWDSFAPEREALEAAVAEASTTLAEGRFLEAKPAAATCRDCGFRPICRAYFSSERL